MSGIGAMPPVNNTLSIGVLGPLKLICKVVDFRPSEAGVKVAVMVQLAPGAIVGARLRQVSVVRPNMELSPPVKTIELISRSTVPLLVMVKIWAADVLPTFTLPKPWEVGETEISE